MSIKSVERTGMIGLAPNDGLAPAAHDWCSAAILSPARPRGNGRGHAWGFMVGFAHG